MIGPNLNLKITGIHFSAFHAFCERVGIKISKYGILRLIEMLPEYQQLTSLRVDAVNDTDSKQESQVKKTA